MEKLWIAVLGAGISAAAGLWNLFYHKKRFSVLPLHWKPVFFCSIAAGGGIGALLSIYGCSTAEAAGSVFLFISLLWLAVIDHERKTLPNTLLICMAIVKIILMIPQMMISDAGWQSILLHAVIGAAATGGLFLLMRILTKKSLGFGDVKLIAVVGAYLGPENVLAAAFIAAFAAAGFGIIQKIRKKD